MGSSRHKVGSNRGEARGRLEDLCEFPAKSSAGAPGKLSLFGQIPQSTIERLIQHGWLRGNQQNDPNAIVTALRRFVGEAFEIP
jgi:hypothetical protein